MLSRISPPQLVYVLLLVGACICKSYMYIIQRRTAYIFLRSWLCSIMLILFVPITIGDRVAL